MLKITHSNKSREKDKSLTTRTVTCPTSSSRDLDSKLQYPIFPPVIQIRVAKFYLLSVLVNKSLVSPFFCIQVKLAFNLEHKPTRQKSQNVLFLVLDTLPLCYISLSLYCFSFSYFTLDQYLIFLEQFFRYTTCSSHFSFSLSRQIFL